MIAPVLRLEMLLGGRRGRLYVFRWVYAAWLIVQFLFLYLGYRMTSVGGPLGIWISAGEFAGSYLQTFVVQQLLIILIATPALAASAITEEKTRGTLQYLLTADLRPGEIILGKLLGRMAQVALLILAGLPWLCFLGVFGGLSPVLLLAVVGLTILPVFALGAASLLASVWTRQTRSAVLGLYSIGGLALLLFAGVHSLHQTVTSAMAGGASGGLGEALLDQADGLLNLLNPIYVLEPGWGGNQWAELGLRLGGAVLAWGGLGAVCLGLAVWRLRPAYIRQLEGAGKKKKTHWWLARRSEVGTDPIRWKARQVEGVAPLAVLQYIPRWLGMTLVFLATVWYSGASVLAHLPNQFSGAHLVRLVWNLDLAGLLAVLNSLTGAEEDFLILALVVVFLASLVVGIRCSGAISGERENQTWEALLLTPLETRQLIRGKLWGILGATYPYLLAYAVPALLLSLLGGWLSFFWVVLGLAMTWLAMFYLGSAGLWCSVRSRTSWRALLGTLGWGYLGACLVYVFTTPLIIIVAVIIWMFLAALDALIQKFVAFSTANQFVRFVANFGLAFEVASCLVLAGVFLGVAAFFLTDARKRVAQLERTRHWAREPGRGPRRRRK
ncbi:MAG: ABC transporter permease subunit [Planctomycetes bacterium]|nr:ABC transporter permease subunit [Planctomycetota bacterium]